MNREIEFAKKLEEVRALARTQGNKITQSQVIELFENVIEDESKYAFVYDYLSQKKVTVLADDEEATVLAEAQPGESEEEISDDDRNYLSNYLDELAQLPKYTDGQKKAAIISAMAGDTQAQGELAVMYLDSVVEIARLYTGQGVFLEDLIGEGNVALTVGATMLGSQENPDECEGVLMKLVMDAMEDLIKETNEAEETDKKALKKVNEILEKAEQLSMDMGRKVTVSELSEMMNISEKSIRDALRISGFNIEFIDDNILKTMGLE